MLRETEGEWYTIKKEKIVKENEAREKEYIGEDTEGGGEEEEEGGIYGLRGERGKKGE